MAERLPPSLESKKSPPKRELWIIQGKLKMRIFGGCQTLFASGLGGLMGTGAVLLSEEPLLLRALYGTGTLTMGWLAAEGVVDTIKGTHHYLGLRTWQKLSKNPETKRKIELDIQKMLKSK